MNVRRESCFSEEVIVFHEMRLPVRAKPVGYAALIDAYSLNVPFPITLSAIGTRHRIINQDGWKIYTPRHEPAPTVEGHLTFALKQEGVDLAVLKALFVAIDATEIVAWVRAKPTGAYSRRSWFLYEWLTGKLLELPNAKKGTYADVVNPKQQYTIKAKNSSRHRVKDNLPGTPNFCPLVFKTDDIETFIGLNLSGRARDVVKLVPRDLLARAASFLQLKDSRSTFAIERETPPQDRIQRWGRVIGQAGQQPLDLDELLRLQKIVIGDARFVKLGLRVEGGFIGDRDRDSQMPLPDHISAPHDHLASLIEGLVEFDNVPAQKLDPVVAAAVLAFGFVYIHPFEDGNGRIHRYLIHHALARRGFNPNGLIFPVSSAILERLDDYRITLESYSRRLLPTVAWEPTAEGNIRILNEVADSYRYFDATPHVTFLFGCVEKTIDEDLPNETRFLRSYDTFSSGLGLMIDMPDKTIDLLFRHLHQNNGRLSKRARNKEFSALTDTETQHIEKLYLDAFSAV